MNQSNKFKKTGVDPIKNIFYSLTHITCNPKLVLKTIRIIRETQGGGGQKSVKSIQEASHIF